MKKTLIALAALAAVGTASAQSTVTLSGILKGGVAQTKYSNGGAANDGSQTGVADGSSRFILSGSEDLGGGLRANFQIDNRFRLDDNGNTPSTIPGGAAHVGTGNTFVGLSGNFGNFQLGKLDTHYCLGADEHGSRATALTASSCAILGYVSAPAATASTSAKANGQNAPIGIQSRSANSLRYTTPNFSGFTAQVSYSTAPAGAEGNNGDTNSGRSLALGLMYAGGPISAGLSVWNYNTEDRTAGVARTDQRAMTAMAKYNFGMGTVGLTVDRSKLVMGLVGAASTDYTRTSYSVPVTFQLGTGTLLATYSRANDTSNIADSGATLWSVGYDYPLSKRTTVGASYVRLNNKVNGAYGLYTQNSLVGGAATVTGQDASQFYVGVRHTF